MKLSVVEAALQRLNQTLGRAEAALEQHLEAGQSADVRDVEATAVLEDRARLASELDEAFARIQRLEEANRDVSERLQAAMDRVAAVLSEAVRAGESA